MKLTQITIERVKNLGNYESKRMGVTAEVSDSDSINVVISDVDLWLNWNLNRTESDYKLKQFTAELGNDELPAATRKAKEDFINWYNKTQARVEAMPFLNNTEKK